MKSPRQNPLIVYGAGGFAREVAWLAETATDPRQVLAFIDDAVVDVGPTINDVPVLSLHTARLRFPGVGFVVAVGSPGVREQLALKAIDAGFEAVTLVHRNVELSRWTAFDSGCIVCAGSILTTNIRLGEHVQINLDCTVGHDVVMEDFATLAPGVHVSGCVRLGRGCYLGTGASVINGTVTEPLVIGDGATVGAGAVVTRSVLPNVTVVGVPAKQRL